MNVILSQNNYFEKNALEVLQLHIWLMAPSYFRNLGYLLKLEIKIITEEKYSISI